MRFFTREWHAGDMPDAEADAVVRAYRRHLAAIRPALPPTVAALAGGPDLHDALVRTPTRPRRL